MSNADSTRHLTPHSDDEALLRRLVGGDADAEYRVRAAVADSRSVRVLVAGAVLTEAVEPLDRAADLATTTRDRQLVALAKAQLEAPAELFDALVRDHLASYPDQLLAAWMAARQH